MNGSVARNTAVSNTRNKTSAGDKDLHNASSSNNNKHSLMNVIAPGGCVDRRGRQGCHRGYTACNCRLLRVDGQRGGMRVTGDNRDDGGW